MSITEAIEELIQSEEFKSISKQRNSIGGAYRSYVSRYKKGLLKPGARAGRFPQRMAKTSSREWKNGRKICIG